MRISSGSFYRESEHTSHHNSIWRLAWQPELVSQLTPILEQEMQAKRVRRGRERDKGEDERERERERKERGTFTLMACSDASAKARN